MAIVPLGCNMPCAEAIGKLGTIQQFCVRISTRILSGFHLLKDSGFCSQFSHLPILQEVTSSEEEDIRGFTSAIVTRSSKATYKLHARD
jgi:hypothetical protein